MTSRDNVLWLQCWRDQRTDFTQMAVNPLLVRFWPGLNLAKGSRVFVPLCGKSLDMLWLTGQGYEVIGVELSPIAVRGFFKENRLPVTQRKLGPFTCWRHGRLSILCGDYFALTKAILGRIDTVYDHTALTALPEDIRKPYVAHLGWIVPKTTPIFLLTTEDADPDADPNLAFAVADEIKTLYSASFAIELAHVENVFGLNPETPGLPPGRAEYKVYRMTVKPLAGPT
jgi:thiopurine S-methyltransferase